jgi:Na+/proline symporter/signal transduction histidine kinase
MNFWVILLISALYLVGLSLVAFLADRSAKSGKNLLKNPYIYSLSLAVFCTAWTYYGSVGKAATDGLSYLTIYIGPIVSMPLWWVIVRKIIQVSSALKITTLADFISTRFAKDIRLSALVTILSILGIVPYISIQLKAINSSLAVIAGDIPVDIALYVTMMLGVFILVFTFRTVDSTQKHPGLVVAVAVESVVKLVAFLIVGGFITFIMFDGFGDLFQRASAQQLAKFEFVGGMEWPIMIFLSISAILFLPRQFHVIVSENADIRHLKTVVWLFPAYLLIINIFVIPVALGGTYLLGNQVDPDMYILALPLSMGNELLAVLTYLGGFSAATGMIIISAIALSMMVSNNLVMPLLIKQYEPGGINRRKALLTRRFSVIVILLLSFFYFRFVSDRFSLVSIGLISFAAVAQFTPSVIAILFWKDVTRQGVTWSLIAGFAVWFYTLIVPVTVEVGILPVSLLTEGPFGINWLKPDALFGLPLENVIVHGTFWSILINIFFLILGTMLKDQTAKDKNMANFYLESYKYSSEYDSQLLWKGHMVYEDLIGVLENILGKLKTNLAVAAFREKNGEPTTATGEVSSQFVTLAERLLTGAVGASAARMLISSISQEEEIELNEVLEILKENQLITRLNRQLKTKSNELQQKTHALEVANKRLMNLDKEKDEFISTVTHEMRTPLTSIRAVSEILYDNDDLSDEERTNFLDSVITETERMTRLINQVLDMEKLESGQTHLKYEQVVISDLIQGCLTSFKALSSERRVEIVPNFEIHDISMNVDRDRMSQVLTNLISNALKFSEENGSIEVGLAGYDDGGIIIWVKDHGKGIDEDSVHRIFDKFYQAQDQTLKKPIGTGLGLSITKQIVNMHGGEIWAESKEGQGTTFFFTVADPKGEKTNLVE